MFCEAIANGTLSERHGRDLDRASSRAGSRTIPSLYASAWHCPDCETTLRVYATVQQVVTGTFEKDCPDCGLEMEPAGHEATSMSRKSTGRRPFMAVPSAFAA